MTQKDEPVAAEGDKLNVVDKVEEAPKPSYADVPVIALKTKRAALLEGGKFSKSVVLADVATLLKSESVDEVDRSTINAAIEFIENPTEKLEDIQLHTTRIGEVCGGYERQGNDTPPAIDALHAHFLSLQCLNRINFVENEMFDGVYVPPVEGSVVIPLDAYVPFEAGLLDTSILTGAFNSPEVAKALRVAHDWALTLEKGYKDKAMLTEVNIFMLRVQNLRNFDLRRRIHEGVDLYK